MLFLLQLAAMHVAISLANLVLLIRVQTKLLAAMCHTMIILFDIDIMIKTNQQWFSVGSTHSTMIHVIMVFKMLWTLEVQPGELALNFDHCDDKYCC